MPPLLFVMVFWQLIQHNPSLSSKPKGYHYHPISKHLSISIVKPNNVKIPTCISFHWKQPSNYIFMHELYFLSKIVRLHKFPQMNRGKTSLPVLVLTWVNTVTTVGEPDVLGDPYPSLHAAPSVTSPPIWPTGKGVLVKSSTESSSCLRPLTWSLDPLSPLIKQIRDYIFQKILVILLLFICDHLIQV